MSDTTVLRTNKTGDGFVKEDVLQYLDMLNNKILALQEENARLGEIADEYDYMKQIGQSQIKNFQEQNEKLCEEKKRLESLITYLQSQLDKSNAELEKFKSAELKAFPEAARNKV